MKRRTTLLAIAASLLTSVGSTSHAQGILSTSRITQISPSQAAVGQTITVTVTTPEIDPALASFLRTRNDLFKALPGRAISGLSSQNQPVKILFSAGSGQFVEGTNVTDLGNQRYSVRVPQGGRTGQLKYQRGFSHSLSTGTFTLVNLGFTIQNSAQYNVVSLKINGAERLSAGQVIAPGASVNLGTSSGNHQVVFTFGINASRPIYAAPLGTFPARQSSGSTFPQPLVIGRLQARQFLAAAPLFTLNGNLITTSWQALDANLNVYGFDFTMNMTTFEMTFIQWAFRKSNVLASGSVREPTNWQNNASSVLVPFHLGNGTLYGNAQLTLSNPGFLPSLIVGDGLIYEMQ
jgi:hypothetical protein